MIFVKDFVYGGRAVDYFWPPAILNKDFLQDLPMVCFVVTQHSESVLSLCLRYSKTSCRQATPKKHPFNIRLNSDDSFLAKQHLVKDFLQRFLAKQLNKIRINSV